MGHITLAISEIFNVKERYEVWVWGRSMSLKMARFDRSCMTFYGFAIVSIDLSFIVFELFEIGAIRKLGCGFLFAFHSNYGRIFSHFGDIQRQRMIFT